MNATTFTQPHQLLVFESESSIHVDKLLVFWKDGRLRHVESGEPIQLKPGAKAVICRLDQPVTHKKSA